MKALLLAGGLGTRLRPLTENLPKPMTPVFHRPWLEHLIVHLRDQGIEDIVLAVKYHADKIQSYFGDGESLGVNLQYAYERQLLGTAGAIKNAQAMLSDTFLVFNADIIHHIDLQPLLEFHRGHRGVVTIGLTEVDDPSQYGVVQRTKLGEIIRFVEKPRREEAPSNLINAGIYVMEKAALDWIPESRETSIERQTFPTLIDNGMGVYGTSIHGYWMDMGTHERYLQVHRDVFDGKFPLRLSTPMVRDGVWMGRNVEIAANVRIEPPVVIGHGAVLEYGSTVGPFTVVGDQAVIGPDCSVRNSVIWPKARIKGRTQLSGAIVGPGFTVTVNETAAREELEAVMQ
ncbi:nucleotidyltransferase [Alicyclobacillus acidoterrestris]|uniref:nucleotidyltransferase family protein n=1 Tax=Alicyclobacillus suci TaxID=2816080 RepID=UPI001194305B|nr:NDP-sugar synthase [Alicyclobacillus suci]GEO26584.1 nucleotidyltransferase [Alicyclobacillus acidoterrestris]